jgi:hypothetical protein
LLTGARWRCRTPASVLLLQQYQRNTKKKQNKNRFTKSPFVTLLLVSQNALYDTKVEKSFYVTDSTGQI